MTTMIDLHTYLHISYYTDVHFSILESIAALSWSVHEASTLIMISYCKVNDNKTLPFPLVDTLSLYLKKHQTHIF